MSDQIEKHLRRKWTKDGVSKKKQDEIIADITAKAQLGAHIGPFIIGMDEPAKIIVCVEGGVVTGALSTDKNINLEVWDWDDRIESEEETAGILSDKFDKLTEGMQEIL
jgi:hypothetical protein